MLKRITAIFGATEDETARSNKIKAIARPDIARKKALLIEVEPRLLVLIKCSSALLGNLFYFITKTQQIALIQESAPWQIPPRSAAACV